LQTVTGYGTDKATNTSYWIVSALKYEKIIKCQNFDRRSRTRGGHPGVKVNFIHFYFIKMFLMTTFLTQMDISG
jgi:hypothetical protein